MNKLTLVFAILIVAILAVGTLYLGYQAFSIAVAVYQGAKTLEPSVYVPLTVTVITATLGLGATLYSQQVARRREIESAHRDRKLEIYLQFMEILEKITLSQKPELGGEKVDENEIARDLVGIRTKAVLWGSPGVLKGLHQLTQQGQSPKSLLDAMEEIQKEMRKDLGLSNFGLEKGFFAKLPLTDPEEYDKL
ncbi:hypothetical protein [Salipiger abyssi]|uniref:hypothetical protein n=1 Tax=Salipiger abyssi TaxID=1250539 RepID=UPI001A8D0661|nr:hypothetical protein [Salipiger abyssi]MBN9888348.1 hypothetical protein [Salipiger abyssi]